MQGKINKSPINDQSSNDTPLSIDHLRNYYFRIFNPYYLLRYFVVRLRLITAIDRYFDHVKLKYELDFDMKKEQSEILNLIINEKNNVFGVLNMEY